MNHMKPVYILKVYFKHIFQYYPHINLHAFRVVSPLELLTVKFCKYPYLLPHHVCNLLTPPIVLNFSFQHKLYLDLI